MKQRFWLFKRGNTFYFQDSETGEQKSLGTKNRAEALRLIELKRESASNPAFSRALLNACLAGQDPLFSSRTWQAVMEQMLARGKEQTKERLSRAFSVTELRGLRNRKLLDTPASDLLSILSSCKASTNHFLRRLHNLALGLGWLPFPIIAPKLWPKVRFKEKRAITSAEHARILAAEKNQERNLYYQLLWHLGAAQSDTASLEASNIDRVANTISFRRKKTGTWSHVVIGKSLSAVLEQLPKTGPLFPKIGAESANDRAAEFYRRCKVLQISGVSLHSYRYAWAERAKASGYPERFAQEALGQGAPPPVASGTFKLALTNGVVAGYEFNLHSTNLDRSTRDAIVRIEIKDVGKTHIEIPAEAMELLGKKAAQVELEEHLKPLQKLIGTWDVTAEKWSYSAKFVVRPVADGRAILAELTEDGTRHSTALYCYDFETKKVISLGVAGSGQIFKNTLTSAGSEPITTADFRIWAQTGESSPGVEHYEWHGTDQFDRFFTGIVMEGKTNPATAKLTFTRTGE